MTEDHPYRTSGEVDGAPIPPPKPLLPHHNGATARFWRKVYLLMVKRGCPTSACIKMADDAAMAFLARVPE